MSKQNPKKKTPTTAAPKPSTGNSVQGSVKGSEKDLGSPGLTESELETVSDESRKSQKVLEDGLARLREQISSVESVTEGSVNLLQEFSRLASSLVEEKQMLEVAKAALIVREAGIARAESERDQGYSDQRLKLDAELNDRRAKAISDLEKEITRNRESLVTDIMRDVNTERERVRSEILSERREWDELRTRQSEALQRQADDLERQKGALAALQSELEGRRIELDDNDRELEVRAERLKQQMDRRRENLHEEVEALNSEELATLRLHVRNASAECDRLRSAIQSQEELLSAYKHLQQQLGGREPAAVITELKTLNDQIIRQREELATRPSEEVREQLNLAEREKRSLENRVQDLTVRLQQNESLASQSRELRLQNSNLEAQNKSLQQRAQIFESAANEATAELRRLRAAYENPAEAEERYRAIESPHLPVERLNTKVSNVTSDTIGELEWLDRIARSCDTYGLHFDIRVLKAFHTALKTSEWSPITVLAGVSGTGKSELPRLYSHFGGLYFEPLSVQPNWDSQESMLGYFNSIDNRFDAQPVLRFLAQSQKRRAVDSDGREYPGLDDALCLVLLDEMNLAHPELYFAEFLSKLELRRGMKGTEVPTLPVKIGSGMDPYKLKLGRNVLWIGTMNQDETTKSLSDKVLDRAIIIYFPRPTELKRRKKLLALDERNRGAGLPLKIWQSWLVQESFFSEEDVIPYKSFIEEMNNSLSGAGRAIGHRVWQSVEYYMANHPDVRAAGDDKDRKMQAMHVAFEDQLVQKVMPKLRGIDTRGKSRDECLERIRGQLVTGIGGNGFNLAEDFDLAMELGYGQFMWQTANYLKTGNASASEQTDLADETS